MIGTLTMSGTKNVWFAPLSVVRNPRATLVCFPYGGGNSAAFRSWSARLPGDVQLLGVDLPGRGSRFCEPLQESVEPLIEALMAQRTFLQAQAPLVFFGHSMGAMIAFEFACALERAGAVAPTHVVVSGRAAPHLPLRNASIQGLPDGRFVEEVQRYQGLPEEVLQHPELVEIVLPILRADFRMSESYHRPAGKGLRCDLTVLGGLDDPMVDTEQLPEWRSHSRGRFELRTFTGGHFYVNDHVAKIIDLALSPVAGQ